MCRPYQDRGYGSAVPAARRRPVTDDTLLSIARFLPTARDLLSLMLSNKRLSIKCIVAPRGSGGSVRR